MARKYKDSGIEWIGQIPREWKVVRTKNVFSLGKELVGTNSSQSQLLSLTTKGIKEVSVGSTSGKVPTSYDTYQLVHKNNLVFCLFDLDCSAVFAGVSNYEGMISPAYKVVSMQEGYYPQFYGYWFDYIFDGRKYKYLSKNIRYSLTYDEFAALGIVAPHFGEQQRIADYLDKVCGEADEMIVLQEKMIEELKAYKQSIITEAVTKGLNPNVPMKNSGIDWIGEIPEHWKTTKIKKIATTNSGSTPRKISNSEGSNIVWIRTTDINDNIVYDSSLHLTNEEFSSASCPMLKSGTCVVAMYGGGGTIGKSGILGATATINQALCSMEVNDSYFAQYLFCVLKSVRYYWMKYAVGTRKDPNINQEIVRNLNIPFPLIEEQRQIASFLDTKCSEIDALIAIKQQKITELKEYKKSVIYEYVTGKKEVV